MDTMIAPELIAVVALVRESLDPVTQNAIALRLMLYGRDFSTVPNQRAAAAALFDRADSSVMHEATAEAYLRIHNAALQAGGTHA